jgi:hypothetical protein
VVETTGDGAATTVAEAGAATAATGDGIGPGTEPAAAATAGWIPVCGAAADATATGAVVTTAGAGGGAATVACDVTGAGRIAADVIGAMGDRSRTGGNSEEPGRATGRSAFVAGVCAGADGPAGGGAEVVVAPERTTG